MREASLYLFVYLVLFDQAQFVLSGTKTIIWNITHAQLPWAEVILVLFDTSHGVDSTFITLCAVANGLRFLVPCMETNVGACFAI